MGDRATEVALFRYALIREAADPKVSKAERGRLVRDLAGRAHAGPGGVESVAGCAVSLRWRCGWRRTSRRGRTSLT